MLKSQGDVELIRAIDRHIEQHFDGDFFVMDEIESALVHIDLFVVPAKGDREHHVVFTCGMAERPMNVPQACEAPRFAELTLSLPAEWPLSKNAWQEERWWWPLRLLKSMARYPHDNGTWLSCGHSVPGSTSGMPFADSTRMTDIVILEPRMIDEETATFHEGSRGNIPIWGLFPAHASEIEFKRRHSAEKLQELLDGKGVTELVQPGRESVISPE